MSVAAKNLILASLVVLGVKCARAHAHECVSISAQSKGEEGGGDVQQSFWQALVVARVYKIVEFQDIGTYFFSLNPPGIYHRVCFFSGAHIMHISGGYRYLGRLDFKKTACHRTIRIDIW